jgi:hypothetical protein
VSVIVARSRQTAIQQNNEASSKFAWIMVS